MPKVPRIDRILLMHRSVIYILVVVVVVVVVVDIGTAITSLLFLFGPIFCSSFVLTDNSMPFSTLYHTSYW
jgi:hypothetical protein